MKKSKKLIPLLLTLAVIFSLLTVAHADEGKSIEVASGSKKATVTFAIENVLAFEGTVTTAENCGFKPSEIAPPKLSLEKEDKKENWRTWPQGKITDQLLIVGKELPATIILTVTLESDSPMKDGAYAVTLTYGRTNANGSYNAGRRVTANIYVGIENPENATGSSKSTLSNSASTAPPQAATPEDPEEPEVVVTEPEGEGETSRVEIMGALDTMMLRSMLDEAEKLKTHGELNREQLEKLQAAIDAGEEAMLGDRQADIDDAAATLYEVIEELGGPISDVVEDEPEKEKSGGGLLVPLIVAVVAVLGIAGILMYLYMKKKMQVKYEGAPIVDYEIGDDDLL